MSVALAATAAASLAIAVAAVAWRAIIERVCQAKSAGDCWTVIGVDEFGHHVYAKQEPVYRQRLGIRYVSEWKLVPGSAVRWNESLAQLHEFETLTAGDGSQDAQEDEESSGEFAPIEDFL